LAFLPESNDWEFLFSPQKNFASALNCGGEIAKLLLDFLKKGNDLIFLSGVAGQNCSYLVWHYGFSVLGVGSSA